MATKFTDNPVTVAADTMLCAETVGGSKGHTTPGDIAGLYGLNNISITYNNTTPNTARPVVVFTPITSDTNNNVVIATKGNGGISIGKIPDNTSGGGTARGQRAVDFQLSRTSSGHVASGNDSALLGGNSNTASGNNSVVIGGSSNTSSVAYSGVFCGSSNNISGGTHSSIVGGSVNIISSSYSFVGGGESNYIRSQSSAAVAARSCETSSSAQASLVTGHKAYARYENQFVQGFGSFTIAAGTAQKSSIGLSRHTTNDTQSYLNFNNSTDTSKQIAIPSNSVFLIKGNLIAASTGDLDVKWWAFSFVVKRASSTTSTQFVGTPTINVEESDTGATSWDLDIQIDTSNARVQFLVTGEAAKTIRWLATAEITEIAV